MSDGETYGLVLFHSVHQALKAEKILKGSDIASKLIPVPKQISSDCGVCLRFSWERQGLVETALEGHVAYREMRMM